MKKLAYLCAFSALMLLYTTTDAYAQEEFWNDPVFHAPRDPSFDTIVVTFCEDTFEQHYIFVVNGKLTFNDEGTLDDMNVVKIFKVPARRELRDWIEDHYGVNHFNEVAFNYHRIKYTCN